MPELPEVETVRLGLRPYLEDKTIHAVTLRRKDLRFPLPAHFARRLTGRTVLRLERRAKYLLARLDDGTSLLMHLGMSGSFRVEGEKRALPGAFHYPRDENRLHDHVLFHMTRDEAIIYNDPRRFGFMDLILAPDVSTHPRLARLGVEPLSETLDAPFLMRAFARRTTSLKAALLDQSVIAGLGNIYASEALFRAGLDPRRPAHALAVSLEECEGLVRAIKSVLSEAVAAGGSSLRDHRKPDGTLGYFQHTFAVYDRESVPCPRCGAPIQRIVQGGRATFFCASCQI